MEDSLKVNTSCPALCTAAPGPSHTSPHTVYVSAMMMSSYLITFASSALWLAAINIIPAAFPINMDNLPTIGDRLLALLVLDHVANENLHVNTLFVLQCMGQPVGAWHQHL